MRINVSTTFHIGDEVFIVDYPRGRGKFKAKGPVRINEIVVRTAHFTGEPEPALLVRYEIGVNGKSYADPVCKHSPLWHRCFSSLPEAEAAANKANSRIAVPD